MSDYWTVYWFQSIACFTFASIAMFSGISGAALMIPWFLMGFALLGVPEITTLQAIAAALFLESAAFSVGIYRYGQRRLIDVETVKRFAPIVVAAAVTGALVAHLAPERVLRVVYSVVVLGAAWLLLKGNGQDERAHEPCREGARRDMQDASGNAYRFCAHGLRLQRGISGTGAFVNGMISTGVGEVTQPFLITRSRYPVPVAVATSIVFVAMADLSAIAVHFVQFVREEGVWGIPWNLIVWGAPGMAAGAFVGTHFQGRVSPRLAKRFFAGLFVLLSITFLAYTFYGGGA